METGTMRVKMLDLRQQALEIVRHLQTAGYEAFWVGGCVRDFLRGQTPQDYDVATSARPDEIQQLFPHTRTVGKQFGVVLVVMDPHTFEVATFRSESNYQDGRHPATVIFGHARADAFRRDFTVNGLFYDPVKEKLYDWVGGADDLKARVIRTIGNPAERFTEDHLRLLRAVRFAAVLDFSLEPHTLRAIQGLAPKIQLVSAERIRDELLKLIRPPHAAQGLDLLRLSGLLPQVLPEIHATISCEQTPDFHPEGTVYQHTIKLLRHLPTDASTSLIWAALLHDVGKPATTDRDADDGRIHFFGHEKVGAESAEHLLERLRLPRRQIEEIVTCVRLHMQLKDALRMRKATLRRMLMRPTFPLELELHRLDCLGSHGQLEIHSFLENQLALLRQMPEWHPPLLTGRELLDLGMKEGPALGRLLAEIREKQLQDELKTPEEAQQWARRRIASG
jgi:poly(A) polymerase